MKAHLFSLIILANLSINIFAMDELFDTDKKEIKDLSEWIAKHQTAIIAGSLIGCGAAAALYKWDKRPAVISSAIAVGFLVYKWLEDQEDDERAQRINAIKEQYGIIQSNIGEITDDLTQIKSSVITMNEKLEKAVVTFETTQKDLEESTDEMKLANACAKRRASLLDDSIETSRVIQSDVKTLIDRQKKLSTLISKSHATVHDTDTANTDIILKAIAGSFGTNSLSIAAGQ
jgi:hypothetical protein